MRTLIVAPHQDDESISCGGLIQSRLASGWDVHVMTLYARRYENESIDVSFAKEFEDFKKAAAVLGFEYRCLKYEEGEPALTGYYRILRPLEEAMREIRPAEVVFPSRLDRNQDHQFLAAVGEIVARPWFLAEIGVERILEFLTPDGGMKPANYYVPMSQKMLDNKLKAVLCYRRESRKSPHPRSTVNLQAWAQIAGSVCGTIYAEPFWWVWGLSCESQSLGGQGSLGLT